MTKKLTRLYLVLDKLPFKIQNIKEYSSFFIISTNEGMYITYFVDKNEYNTYLEYAKLSKSVSRPIYELWDNHEVLLVFEYEDKTEYIVKGKKLLPILEEIFEKSSYEITLKKDHLINLNNIYKVLDNKFSYFEMRIREIELSPIKNDISWIVLSKYHIILDAKVYLYDLQTDIFKYIDKNMIVKYGLISKDINEIHYCKEKILPSYISYFGPKGILYSRYLLVFNYSLLEKVKQIDEFNQKYFCFMTLYILILNLNISVILDNNSISNYLLITQRIQSFLTEYKSLIEK